MTQEEVYNKVIEDKTFSKVGNNQLKEYNLNTMRSPVVETKELTTVDIYNLKEEFDLYLEEREELNKDSFFLREKYKAFNEREMII